MATRSSSLLKLPLRNSGSAIWCKFAREGGLAAERPRLVAGRARLGDILGKETRSRHVVDEDERVRSKTGTVGLLPDLRNTRSSAARLLKLERRLRAVQLGETRGLEGDGLALFCFALTKVAQGSGSSGPRRLKSFKPFWENENCLKKLMKLS